MNLMISSMFTRIEEIKDELNIRTNISEDELQDLLDEQNELVEKIQKLTREDKPDAR